MGTGAHRMFWWAHSEVSSLLDKIRALHIRSRTTSDAGEKVSVRKPRPLGKKNPLIPSVKEPWVQVLGLP